MAAASAARHRSARLSRFYRKDREHAVADKFQHVAALGMDRPDDGVEIGVQRMQKRRLAPALGLGRKIAQIGKQHYGFNNLVFAAQDRPVADRLRRPGAEICPQQALGRAAHGERLEGGGQGVAGIGDQVEMRLREPARIGGHEAAGLCRAVAIFERHGQEIGAAASRQFMVHAVVRLRIQPDQTFAQDRPVGDHLLERAALPGAGFQRRPRNGVFGRFLRRPDHAPGR